MSSLSSLSSLFSPPIIPQKDWTGLNRTTSTWTKHLKRIFYGLWTILDINWRRRQLCGPQTSRNKARDNRQKTALYFRLVLPRGEKKRKKIFFGKIFHLGRNTKVGFAIIFAADFEKTPPRGSSTTVHWTLDWAELFTPQGRERGTAEGKPDTIRHNERSKPCG